MGKTVFVGDVHGCRDELDALLAKVGFSRGDRLVMVGDLVVRGPDPRGTLDLLRDLGARAVRGNHEDRLLAYHAAPEAVPLNSASMLTARALRKRHWAFLEALPLWIDLPEHEARVVHAGLAPGVPIEQQTPRTLMYVRCLDAAGAPVEKRGAVLWGERYAGPPHVVFGHNARAEPQIHAWATGLDTGCVYGGELTALVLGDGERPPPARDRASALVSVRARRRYAEE
jgi:Calcineurin-like phosphoesterase